jgi:DNA damage-inducible protein 1
MSSFNLLLFSNVCTLQASEWDGKVQRLVKLGFDKNLVLHALCLFQGDEDQAAGYLFGG